MKKHMLFSLSITGLVIGFSLTGCDNGVAEKKYNPTMVCLGDSLTAGYGATVPKADDKTKSYPAYLQNKVNIPVINAGVSGNTTSQALARINTDVLSQNPQIVIILLGANDLLQWVNIADTEYSLQEIISKINNGNRKIYLAKFYTDEIGLEIGKSMGAGLLPEEAVLSLINDYNTMFNTLASSNNVTLIEDIWDGVWGVNMSDEYHPNAAGYETMAGNIFKAIQPYLQAYGFLK